MAILLTRGRVRSLIGLGLVVFGACALRVAAWRPFDVSGGPPDDGMYRASGVVHVHTTHSDGGGTSEEVLAAARAAGLRFLALTDHGNLDAQNVAGYHDGLLVLVGTEVSTTAGHVLGLGIQDPVFRFPGDPLETLGDIHALGGFAVAAHPENARVGFRWTGWELPGAWGLELVNGDSQWRDAGVGRLLRTATLYGLNRSFALLTSLRPPDQALGHWDAMLAQRDVPGLAGADAHSRMPLRKGLALRFPSYESLFRLVRNHVLLREPLTGEAASDSRAVVAALASGRSYIGVDALAPADGVSFIVEGAGRLWTMGETAPAGAALRLRVGGRLPRGARIMVLRDGRPFASGSDRVEAGPLGPGVYRAEVRLAGWEVPWVLSNPIYVFDDAERERRRERAAWPAEGEPPAPRLVLDSFEGPAVFQREHDSFSEMEGEAREPGAGPDGSTAARFAFRLGAPDPGHPHTFCALVSRGERDLSGFRGLVFWIKGDGVYRTFVQVRDANPASADDGVEFWFASARTSTAWRRVAIPFERFRSINPKSDGRLDLAKVREVVFVLDRGAVKVGARGTIWLDDIGVY